MAVDGLYLKSAEVSILAFLSGCRINNSRRIIKVGWSDPDLRTASAVAGCSKLGSIRVQLNAKRNAKRIQNVPSAPQPTDSSATYIHFILRENRRYSRLGSRKSLIASDQFGDSTWVSSGRSWRGCLLWLIE